MELNSLNNTLSYLDPNKLIQIFNYKLELVEIFLKYLINNTNDINAKHYKNLTITNYYNFVPLPTKLKTNHLRCNVTKNNNYKIYNTKDIILPGDIVLPHSNFSSIPFTFGLTINNKYTLVNSSVYYYEIKLDKKPYINKFNNKTKNCISIGFGTILNSVVNQQVGWSKDTFAIHSDDGKYFNGEPNGLDYNAHFSYDDIIGAGIIYKSKSVYEPFFTINGRLLNKLDDVNIIGYITPQIGFDHIVGFNVNFGKKPFKFRIMNVINKNINIISSFNKFVFKGYDKNMYKYVIRKQLKSYISLNKNKNITINYNPMNNIKFNNFTSTNFTSNNFTSNNLISPLTIQGHGINLINNIPNDTDNSLEETIEEIEEEISNESTLPLLSIPSSISLPPIHIPPPPPLTSTSNLTFSPNFSTNIMNNIIDEIQNKLNNDINQNNGELSTIFNDTATNYFSNINNFDIIENFDNINQNNDNNNNNNLVETDSEYTEDSQEEDY
jgi:hypothetical protein